MSYASAAKPHWHWFRQLSNFPCQFLIDELSVSPWFYRAFWLIIPLETYIGYKVLDMFKAGDILPPIALVFAKAILYSLSAALIIAVDRPKNISQHVKFLPESPQEMGRASAWVVCILVLWLVTDTIWSLSVIVHEYMQIDGDSKDTVHWLIKWLDLDGDFQVLGNYPGNIESLIFANTCFGLLTIFLLLFLQFLILFFRHTPPVPQKKVPPWILILACFVLVNAFGSGYFNVTGVSFAPLEKIEPLQ